jgi:hypothetical protein
MESKRSAKRFAFGRLEYHPGPLPWLMPGTQTKSILLTIFSLLNPLKTKKEKDC